jgi:hypothetical protein
MVILIFGTFLWTRQKKGAEAVNNKVGKPVASGPVVDYNKLEKDKELQALMDDRKAKYGVEKGIDMVVKSGESLKIGDETVSMKDIIDKTRLERGELIEKDVQGSPTSSDNKEEEYGIYVVQPGDNIWNIHFKLMKDYYARKMISISPMADEADRKGYSSGVGKLLKFSENMVYIYNVKERNFSDDLNLIQALSKIVVYNMSEVFSLLDQVDQRRVNRIQFDGETIWIPAEQ